MGFSIWQLVIVLLIVIVLFGTKKLKNVGKDLGDAIKGFKDATKDGDDKKLTDNAAAKDAKKDAKDDNVIEGEVTKKENDKV